MYVYCVFIHSIPHFTQKDLPHTHLQSHTHTPTNARTYVYSHTSTHTHARAHFSLALPFVLSFTQTNSHVTCDYREYA